MIIIGSRIDATFETLLVLISYPKGRLKILASVSFTPYSVLSFLNSIDFLLIDRKDESIVIFFMERAGIPILLGIAAKDFALLSF